MSKAAVVVMVMVVEDVGVEGVCILLGVSRLLVVDGGTGGMDPTMRDTCNGRTPCLFNSEQALDAQMLSAMCSAFSAQRSVLSTC